MFKYAFDTSLPYDQDKVENAITKIREFHGYNKTPFLWHDGPPDMFDSPIQFNVPQNDRDILKALDVFSISDLNKALYEQTYPRNIVFSNHAGHLNQYSYILTNEVQHEYFDVSQIGYWVAFKAYNFVGLRPKTIIHRDYAFHCTTGPAVTFHDGTEFWYVDNIKVDEEFVLGAKNQTVRDFLTEHNKDKLNSRIELFGWKNYLELTENTIIDRRDEEILYRATLKDGYYPLVKYVFRCVCPSTGNEHYLQVPLCLNCESAQNWLRGSTLGKLIGAT